MAIVSLFILYFGRVSFASLPDPLLLTAGAIVIDTAALLNGGSHIARGVQDTVHAVLFAAFASVAGILGAYAGQSFALPLRDRLFVDCDRAVGFDWNGATLWVDRHPLLANALSVCYETMSIQIVMPICVFAFSGQKQRLRVYLLAYAIALAITDFVGALLPALSPIASLAKGDFHVLTFSGASPLDHLTALRNGEPVFISGALGGIVSFPSFHATVAVLTPLALIRHTRALLILLPIDALMLAAAVTEGAHYACDVVSGACVAVVAMASAERLLTETPPAGADNAAGEAVQNITAAQRRMLRKSTQLPF